ncbi:thyroid transcription factor 1-associated protein 26 homolog isoform X1 [Tachysurus fulvidraco]|uniref:thyroid transcription factor 1-associated protein 26 homolog isoform X1 n=1 Tax=Tachysurus fulvidraco TaxID=1234273 RepID=UPI000F4F333D|nr:thyroid transcription factor 1-associated protein 26 homolog isoform X1 [Tachysurus fulvidraco]
MAPVNPHFKGKPSFKGRNPKRKNTDSHHSAVNRKKKTWNPGNKVFQGSLQEGKGFAFQRKQKVQQEYKKLLRKEKWRMKESKPNLEDEYPEHLKHLYMAEQQKLNEEEQLNKDRRRKGRIGTIGEGEEDDSAFSSSVARTSETGSAEKSAVSLNKGPQTSRFESSSVQDQFTKKKWKKMSSNQKMMEEYKRKKEERERKREEYLKDKAQREEALKKYKEKKMATYQLLKKKTKKGQPNLNLQMELLLQKIQAQRK